MIKCKDCKHLFIDRKGAAGCYKADEDPRNHSCIQAERADGLTECCATCKHNWLDSAGPYCHEGNWHHNVREDFRYDKMKCPEWQPREEK